jgi:hypothetical protein
MNECIVVLNGYIGNPGILAVILRYICGNCWLLLQRRKMYNIRRLSGSIILCTAVFHPIAYEVFQFPTLTTRGWG